MASSKTNDLSFSTKRLVTKDKPEIVNKPEEKFTQESKAFESLPFLPEGEGRCGEGGLRTQGYFKKSYEGKPLISIITVVYNGEKYLEETIQSVINQTYDNVEYIIIDGGSTDGTLDIIKKYEDQIDYWVSEKDSGIYDAMNKGVSLASGDIIGLLNADDLYHKEALHSVAEARMHQQNKKVIYYGIAKYVVDNQVIKSVEKEFSKDNILRGFGFLHTTCFVPRDVYKEVGLFDATYKIAGDTDFLLRCYIEKIAFKKNDNITYMRLGGVSDKQMDQANQEYLQQLEKYDLVDKAKISSYRRLFLFARPYLKLRYSKAVKNTLLQAKFLIIACINVVYNMTPFFFLKNRLLKIFGMEIGKCSYIHNKAKFFNYGNISIGNNTVVNINCYLDNRREIIIGNNVAIAHDCKIYTMGHELGSPFLETKGKKVIIEDNVFIFSNVLIMPGVVIRKGAVIYAGSVVTKDVEPFMIVGGNPAEPIKKEMLMSCTKMTMGSGLLYKKKSLIKLVQTALLSIILIFSFQSFFYIKDFYILYFMSKLVIPLLAFFLFVIYVMLQLSRYRLRKIDAWILSGFTFLILVSATNGYIYYDQDFFVGITGQIKLLSIFLFYLILFVFTKLKITSSDLTRSILFIGTTSIIIFVLVHFLIPPESVYFKDSFIVKFSAAKGFYYTLPTQFFVATTMFYFMIKVFESKSKLFNLLVVFLFLIVLILLYKQRMSIFFTGLGLLYICIVYSSGILRNLFLFSTVLLIFSTVYFAMQSDGYISFNSESWQVRIRTVQTILGVLSDDPLRILLGSGNLSPVNTSTFQDLYGPSFWVSDVGVLGIIFEFGVMGSLFIYCLFFYIFFKYWKINKNAPYILQALKTKVLIMVIGLPLSVGVAYSIGLIVTLLAIVLYFGEISYNKEIQPVKEEV